MRKLPLTTRSGDSAPTECANTRPELTPTIGSAMASAEREPTRAPARVESESVRDQHLGAGGCTVSLASGRFHRAEDRLARFNAGPIGVHDYLAWSARSIEGAAQQARGESQQGSDCQQRVRYLASFHLMARFARPLWDGGAWL